MLSCTVCADILSMQIAGDKLTRLAAQHWSEAARAQPDRPAFSPEIVEQIYKQELSGGNSRPPALKRVMLLEVSRGGRGVGCNGTGVGSMVLQRRGMCYGRGL